MTPVLHVALCTATETPVLLRRGALHSKTSYARTTVVLEVVVCNSTFSDPVVSIVTVFFGASGSGEVAALALPPAITL